MTKYIAIYEEVCDDGSPYRSMEHTAEIDCDSSDPLIIYLAFRHYGLADYELEDAMIYRVKQEFFGSDIIPKIGKVEDLKPVSFEGLRAVTTMDYDSLNGSKKNE